MTTILRGNLVTAPALGGLEVRRRGCLVLEDGVVTDVLDSLPEALGDAVVEDFGDCLITQSLADLHLHAPQYPMLGTGMDLPLLDWLNTHAFPTEARFADPDYARAQYRALAAELIENGTTRVCMFSSLHLEATLILMEELEQAGVTGYVGKVNMDRNGAPALQEDSEQSYQDTRSWIEACRRFTRVKPILTPRFTPSCSDGLMARLGELAQEYDLPVQSHLSENLQELAWVRQLHPDCTQYWQTYAKFGLWNHRTVMAHCVWSDKQERAAMAEAGVTAVHCAASNRNICSGVAPVRAMLQEGVSVALGTDIAGGETLSMFDAVADAVRASKTRRIMDNWETDFLTVAEAWYLGTTAGAAFFGGQPGFGLGQPLHALVVDDGALPPLESVEERLSRCVYRRQKDAIRAVWSEGRRVK